jgi:hypothetical protein
VKRLFAICLLATSIGLVGCGTPEASDIMENADQSAIDEYERLVAEQDAAMEEDGADAEDPAAAAPAE